MSDPIGGGGYDPRAPRISIGWIVDAWQPVSQRMGMWMLVSTFIILVIGSVYGLILFPTGLYKSVFAPAPANASILSDLFGHSPGEVVGNLAISLCLTLAENVVTGCCGLVALRQLRGEAVTAATFFDVGGVLPSLIGASLIMSVANLVGFYMCLIPGLLVGGLFLFAPLYVVDRKMGPIEALRSSANCLAPQLLMAAWFYVVINFVSGLGIVACCIGVLISMPIAYMAVTIAYMHLTYWTPPTPNYGPSTAGTWPPPPDMSSENGPV